MGKYHITQSNFITVGSDGGRCLDHFILHRVKENVAQQESREKTNVSLQILEAEFIIMILHHIVSLCESVYFFIVLLIYAAKQFLIDSAIMTIKMLNKDLILELCWR